jgi:hypothetical protein
VTKIIAGTNVTISSTVAGGLGDVTINASGGGGSGVPVGGTQGQVLTKYSSTNYDTIWSTPSGGGGGLQSYWIDLNCVAINTGGQATIAVATATNNCYLSSITTSAPLPSGWSVTAPIGNSAVTTSALSIITFTNSNITSRSQSYAAVPIFLQSLTLATQTSVLTSVAVTSALYVPFPFGNSKTNTSSFIVPVSSNSVKITQGIVITASGLLQGGLNSGLTAIGATTQSNDGPLPSTFFTAIKFNVLFPSI